MNRVSCSRSTEHKSSSNSIGVHAFMQVYTQYSDTLKYVSKLQKRMWSQSLAYPVQSTDGWNTKRIKTYEVILSIGIGPSDNDLSSKNQQKPDNMFANLKCGQGCVHNCTLTRWQPVSCSKPTGGFLQRAAFLLSSTLTLRPLPPPVERPQTKTSDVAFLSFAFHDLCLSDPTMPRRIVLHRKIISCKHP